MDFSWTILVEGQENNIKTVHWRETLEIMVVFALKEVQFIQHPVEFANVSHLS